MAYETLINSTIIKPANKPNYSPAKSLKKALKVVRKFFKKSQKHQKFLDESVLETSIVQQIDDAEPMSDEECENMENERLEASSSPLSYY